MTMAAVCLLTGCGHQDGAFHAPVLLALLAACCIAGACWTIVHDRRRQRKRMEQQLSDARRDIFTQVSHEFRTPLTLIRGALEIIRKSGQLPGSLEQPMTLMERNADQMMHLLNQLLDHRRIESGVMSLRLEKTDIIGQLRQLFDSFGNVAAQKHLGYKMNTQHRELWGYFDRSCIDRVIYTLLSNAIRFTPEGGHILLEVRANPAPVSELTIRIVDDGVGIPEEQRSHLFERTRHHHYLSGSTGIGLNLCAALIEVHHGVISYDPNPSGGSIFTVTLPLSEESYTKEDYVATDNEKNVVEPADAEPAAPLVAPVNAQRILVIEANDDVREYVRAGLQPYFNIDAVESGRHGLERIEVETDAYDVVVTGTETSDITGLELSRCLRQSHDTSHLPIVMLTAPDSADSQIEGLQAGVDAFVAKPFSIQLLLATIIHLLNRHSRLKERFSADKSRPTTMITTSQQDREFLEKLDAVIDRRMKDADFGADDFAGEMAMGRTIFFHKVKEVTGFSPKEYLRVRRMKRSAALLAEGKLTVQAVAYEVGLKDPFYFSRCFKQQFGMTPSDYQRQMQENPSS